MRRVFVRFLGESSARKKRFEIYWPLNSNHIKDQKRRWFQSLQIHFLEMTLTIHRYSLETLLKWQPCKNVGWSQIRTNFRSSENSVDCRFSDSEIVYQTEKKGKKEEIGSNLEALTDSFLLLWLLFSDSKLKPLPNLNQNGAEIFLVSIQNTMKIEPFL